MNKILCCYGCGKEANHQFKNGKWCCSENFETCPQIKENKKQTFMEKYGVDNSSKIKGVQEKMRQTYMEKYGVEHPFQSKRVQEKIKQTNIEKYGVDYSIKNKKIQEKRKQTYIEKFGVEHPLKNKEVQEKRKQTCLEKYGVGCPLQNKEIKDKIKQTFIKKYGVEHSSQNKKVQEKRKQTTVEKYGVEHHLKSKTVIEKMKQTNMEKYGAENPSQNKEIQEKRKQTFMENYGVENPSQSLEAKEQLLKRQPFLRQVEEIKIEDNQFKVHCKNSNCVNSKENGGWFTPTKVQINNRIAALKIETGNGGNFFYCSEHCKTTCDAFNIHGDPNRDNQLPYTQEQYQTFKLHVLTRDNYICQYCGKPATDVHHERPVKLEPFFSLDPDYAWSCCEKCHYAKGHPKETECSTGNLAAKVCRPIKINRRTDL